MPKIWRVHSHVSRSEIINIFYYLTFINSIKVLARDSAVYFVSITGQFHASVSKGPTQKITKKSLGVLIFNLIYGQQYGLIGMDLAL